MISVVAICQHAKILHNYWIYYPPCRESWEQKNWCLWTVVLEKSLESPLDCKEIQPVHPKGDQSWCSLEGLMKLKLQSFSHLMQTADSFEKTLMLAKEEKGTTGDEMGWMASPTQWTWVWVDSTSWWWTGGQGMLWFMVSQSQTWLSDWKLIHPIHFILVAYLFCYWSLYLLSPSRISSSSLAITCLFSITLFLLLHLLICVFRFYTYVKS